ncbi:MAG: diaminopimelate epimerase, partial [Pseudomonadota bacterium]
MTGEYSAHFWKMNGLGNEIVVVDMRAHAHLIEGAQAVALADNPATRFDQLMAVHAPRSGNTDAYIAIYNSDGSAAGACGNGMRCVGLAFAPIMSKDRL